MKTGITSSDIVCVATNIIVFVVIQCLFFYLFASRQYDKLVQDKLDILQPFLDDERLGRYYICEELFKVTNAVREWQVVTPPLSENIKVVEYKTRVAENTTEHRAFPKYMSDDAVLRVESEDGATVYMKPVFEDTVLQEAAEEARKHNLKCLITWTAPFVVLSGIVLFTAVVFASKNKSWTRTHTIGLGLIVTCFLTEVIYFFSVLRPYEPIGDWELLEAIFLRGFSR